MPFLKQLCNSARWWYKLGVMIFIANLATLHFMHFNKISLLSLLLSAWALVIYTPGNALSKTLLHGSVFIPFLWNVLFPWFFAGVFFPPGGLYPPLKPQFGILPSLSTVSVSHTFLTFYFLQPKYFCYSLPNLFLSVYQDLEQGTGVPKKPLLSLLWALLSHLHRWPVAFIFGPGIWLGIAFYFLPLIFVRQAIVTFLWWRNFTIPIPWNA